MAYTHYVIDLLATGTATVTINDPGINDAWMEFSPGYVPQTGFPTNILLGWNRLAGVSTDANGNYFTQDNSAINIGHNLVVHGAIENARGSNFTDVIQGNELNNIIFGDYARTGLGGTDTIHGDDGNDRIYGGLGDDLISGDNGNDLIYGDAGADTITGGGGIDTIQGGAGADSLSGGADAGDVVSYSESAAAVTVRITFGSTSLGAGGDAQGDHLNGFSDVIGSASNDTIIDTVAGNLAFGYNANRFFGGAGDDTLRLGGGNDHGYGGIGNDFVLGEAGNDTLSGDAGADKLTGGIGADYLTGGSEADLFIFTTAAESTVLAAGRDLIADFSHAEGDKIHLRAMDADPSLALDQNFTFIGAAGFDGRHGLLRVVVSGANSLVFGDLDGDKVADFSILVVGVTNLIATDFVL